MPPPMPMWIKRKAKSRSRSRSTLPTARDTISALPKRLFDDPSLVQRIAPGRLATETTTRGIPLVHISTDYMFDGRKAGLVLRGQSTTGCM
jgi:RmlD substrate binding domain